MKLIQTIAATTLTLLASHSFAMSSTIPLKGGNILPGQVLAISTEKLYSPLRYTLTCTMRNEDPRASETSDFSVYSRTDTASIDGKVINTGTGTVAHFRSKGSILKVTPIDKSTGRVEIRNLDYTDTITVDNCNAALIG